MPWLTLGTLTPGFTWQQFDTPVVGGDLFRLTQTWQGNYPAAGPAWLSSVFANDGISAFRRFFSNEEPLLIEMPTPESFVNAGFLVRYIQLRLGVDSRPFADSNWQVTLELWTDSTDATGQPAQRLSGGTYVGT